MTPLHLLSATGRASRGQFWLQSLVIWLALYGLAAALGMLLSGVLVWLVNGAALLALVMLCIRRLHDRNYAGWWVLVVLIPVLGALWLVWQLALRRGVAHDNRWGADPRQLPADYLVVR
jgi:uncharacterized membrane protein YhaH (DUF805 family)